MIEQPIRVIAIGGRLAAMINEVASCRSSLWFIRREARLQSLAQRC